MLQSNVNAFIHAAKSRLEMKSYCPVSSSHVHVQPRRKKKFEKSKLVEKRSDCAHSAERFETTFFEKKGKMFVLKMKLKLTF